MSNLTNRGWDSRDQNTALSEWKVLVSLIVCTYADGDVADAICRNRYSPGVKKPPVPGELGEMEGPPPAHLLVQETRRQCQCPRGPHRRGRLLAGRG
jgi:hypothetical protein